MRTPPVATYRLQLHRGFGFEEASRVVPYLAGLGVSHVYLSPIFEAMPGSMHGYDVLDPGRINPELGGEAGWTMLTRALEAHGMQAILDIVPNHVWVAGARQRWWRNVLRWGPASPFAHFFDIDWERSEWLPPGVLCLPILNEEIEETLGEGGLRLALDDGEVGVAYGETWLPLAPETYGDVLGVSGPLMEAGGGASPLASVAQALSAGRFEARREALDAFTAQVRDDDETGTMVNRAIEGLTRPGERSRLRSILDRQHYRLASWRTVGEALNYRRFFAIDDLAAVRVEDERVFETTHALALGLAAERVVAGLRIDHIDGLYDPVGYLERVRGRLDRVQGERRIVLLEKILAADEPLPANWPADGSTGYEFIRAVDGLFIDGLADEALTQTYTDFTGQRLTFEQVETVAREESVEREFVAERERLLRRLKRAIAPREESAPGEDDERRLALTAVLAGMRRYRTYLDHGETSPEDAAALDAAMARAVARRPEAAWAIEEVAGALRPELPAPSTAITAERIRFRRLFDQVSSAVAAKGVEDTAFYRYSRLLALNEVGGSPERPGMTPGELHGWLAMRARERPLTLSASSTHDTKRDEDVRARIAVLSEMPTEWEAEVNAWREMNAGHRRLVEGEGAPSRESEYYVYQTLAGTWEGDAGEEYRTRIAEHLIKALREAGRRTTWIDPDDAYERAGREFVNAILGERAFAERLDAFVEPIRRAGRLNALAGLVLKTLAPGVPDIYQGTEVARYSLTDPDNRRPVDFEQLTEQLRRLGEDPPAISSPAMKQWLIRRLLHIRASLPDAMASAAYAPIAVSGMRAGNIFAFQRGEAGGGIAVIIPKLALRLLDSEGGIPAAAWDDTAICLPAGQWRNLLTSDDVEGGDVACSQLLQRLPFAVLSDSPGTRR